MTQERTHVRGHMLHKISTSLFVDYYRSYAMLSEQLEFNKKTELEYGNRVMSEQELSICNVFSLAW